MTQIVLIAIVTDPTLTDMPGQMECSLSNHLSAFGFPRRIKYHAFLRVPCSLFVAVTPLYNQIDVSVHDILDCTWNFLKGLAADF